MNNTTDMLNQQKLADYHRAAAQYRRAREADVKRKSGMRSAAARLLRRTADFIDSGRTPRASRVPTA